jgi:excisionase family DNA binding protein
MVNERLLTTKELAAYLRVTTRTVARLLKDGAIPVVRVGSVNRYQLDKVIEELLIPEEVEILEETEE